MIPVEKLIYDSYRKFNGSNSSKNKKINIVDLVSYLNEAYEIWYVNKVLSLQETPKLRNDIRTFLVKKHKLELDKLDSNCYLARYPSNFYQRLNQVATTSCEDCDKSKDLIIRIVESDDLEETRRNPFRKTDFKWGQLIADEGSEGLYIYSDKELEVECVYIDYYRKPRYLQAAELLNCGLKEYTDYTGSPIQLNQDFEVEETFANREVSDICVLLISRDVKDLQGYQSQLQKILNVDKLYRY